MGSAQARAGERESARATLASHYPPPQVRYHRSAANPEQEKAALERTIEEAQRLK